MRFEDFATTGVEVDLNPSDALTEERAEAVGAHVLELVEEHVPHARWRQGQIPTGYPAGKGRLCFSFDSTRVVISRDTGPRPSLMNTVCPMLPYHKFLYEIGWTFNQE